MVLTLMTSLCLKVIFKRVLCPSMKKIHLGQTHHSADYFRTLQTRANLSKTTTFLGHGVVDLKLSRRIHFMLAIIHFKCPQNINYNWIFRECNKSTLHIMKFLNFNEIICNTLYKLSAKLSKSSPDFQNKCNEGPFPMMPLILYIIITYHVQFTTITE